MSRCYKPDNFGNAMEAEVRHFSDASEEGANAHISGTNLIKEFETIHCSLLIGKSSVSPVK